MVIRQRIVADGRRNEIAWDDLRALMDQLIKSMLPIRSRLSPDHRAGGIRNRLVVAIHILSIALHIPLLEIRRKPVQVLIIWQNGFGTGTKKIGIPDAQHGHDNGNIFFESSIPEM